MIWIILAFMAGGLGGVLAMALAQIAKESDSDE
jgi:hypothetical protein